MADDSGEANDGERASRTSGGPDEGADQPSTTDGSGEPDEDEWIWKSIRSGWDDGSESMADLAWLETKRSVGDDVVEYFETTEIDWPGVETPAEAFLRERFFDFSYLAGAAEVEQYWVQRPFAYVSVLYDAGSRTHYYWVSEPLLDDSEEYVRRDLETYVRDVLDTSKIRNSDSAALEREIRRIVADFADEIPAGSLHKIVYYLRREFTGYGRIDPLMRDDRIEDISCDGSDVPVFVYHRQYNDLPTNLVFEGEALDSFVRWLAQQTGHSISFSDPVVSATLPRGDRLQLILGGDISVRGSTFTIRRFQEIPFTPVELIGLNTFSVMEIAYLWLCIEHQKSTIFVGPTASGKTTSMNAVSLFIRPYAKVVTIERTRELSIPHDNWVSTVTRERRQGTAGNDVTVYDLLHSSLHQRPEYIVIGEIRTEPEVLQTFLQSVFTGHAGYTTFHARDIEETLGRFRSEPFNAEDQMISSVDIVSVQRQVYLDEERHRRAIRIAELSQDEDGAISTTEAFEWEPSTDTHRVREDLFELPALREIAEEHGWSETQLLEELNRRRDFLEYLVRNDVTEYRDVWASIFAFHRDRESVIEEVAGGTFDPTSITLDYYD